MSKRAASFPVPSIASWLSPNSQRVEWHVGHKSRDTYKCHYFGALLGKVSFLYDSGTMYLTYSYAGVWWLLAISFNWS